MGFSSIAFIGDSFTWGEGLEFYQDLPKWIEQRTKYSDYPSYRPLVDDNDNQFRESNRFAGLVCKHFNSTIGIDNRNGGSFKNAIEMLEAIKSPDLNYEYIDLNLTKIPNVIIFQFSVFSRNSIHFHLGADKFECHCDLCEYFNKIGMGQRMTFDEINRVQNVPELWNTDQAIHFETWLKNTYPNLYGDRRMLAYNVERELSPIHLEFLLDTYIRPFEKMGIYTFFIDSWEKYSSEIIFMNDYIKDRIIPLIGYDGKYYLKYGEWENTFSSVRISYDFPQTQNGHPTLIQHEYLGKSIIEYLEKIKYQPKFI